MFVDGKPYLILSGELTNNAATLLIPWKPFSQARSHNLNTVLVAVSWASLSRRKVNFITHWWMASLQQGEHLHIVFLWFGCVEDMAPQVIRPTGSRRTISAFPASRSGKASVSVLRALVELLST